MAMSTRTKWWAGGAALALLVLLLAWAFAPQPLAVELAEVRQGRFEQAVEDDAKTRVQDRYLVSAPLAGRWLRPQLKEGDAVPVGGLLGLIQPAPVPMQDARSQAELQARAEAAEAALTRAGARLGGAEVALAQARQELRRSEQLSGQGFVAAAKRDSDALAVRAAEQERLSAQAERHVGQHELAQARAALGVYVQGSTRSFELRAPVAAQVLRVHQPSETVVGLGTPLLELGDTSRLEVVAELLSTDALPMRAGQPVLIERWGGPGTLRGHVARVEPGAFTKISALGVEEQRVRVIVALDSPPAERAGLGDGYRVAVRVLTRSADQALLVPGSAVFPLPGDAAARHAVYLLQDGRARLTPVRLQARNSAVAWIAEGLSAGAQVVVYPPAELKDGLRIRVR